MNRPKIDLPYVTDILVKLLETPSPSGRTDEVMHLIARMLEEIGVETELTRRGALIANLPGEQDSPDRAVVVHADTIGAMVRAIEPDGRLRIVPVGTHPARSAEGAHVRIFTDDQQRSYEGTILPLKASGHAYGDEVDTQPFGWEHLIVRIDAETSSAAETAALGINVGDHVAFISSPRITDTGFITARHLDGKAGVAAAIGAIKSVLDAGVTLPVSAHLLVTIAEEVGLGASSGLHADIAESVAIDNAVVAPGQTSSEHAVSVCMQDSSGPMDYHLSRKLLTLADKLGIEHRRDVYRHYRSDSAAALEAGAEMRAALVGFGVDASHGHERTHLDSLEAVATLIAAYLQSPLTFAWDAHTTGKVEDFPQQDSAPLEE